MSDCLFCDAVLDKLIVFKIFEDDQTLLFLDKKPLFFGHCLLIPKYHCATVTDLPSHLIQPFFARLQQACTVVEQGMGAQGVFVAMNNKVSQSVPHLHAHIVPRSRGDGLKGFFWPRKNYEPHDIEVTQARLRTAWQKLYGV